MSSARSWWKSRPRSAWDQRRKRWEKRWWKSGYFWRQNEEKSTFLLMLSTLESLIDRAASMAKAKNDNKTAWHQFKELQRHDRAMEQGHGLYLASYKYGCRLYLDPYKRGQGSCKEKKNIKETIKMPSGATNVQLNELAKRMRVPYFRSLIFSFHVLY